MKKLLIFLLLFVCLTIQAQTTYYTGGGSDVSGNGSIANPWATLKHATDTIIQSGNTIYVNVGTYTETAQSALAVGVNITGAGATSIILSHIATAYTPTILLHSTAEGTNGNQSISYIKMDGDALTADWAIEIDARSNVKIHHCEFVNFLNRGVIFNGKVSMSDPVSPTTWSSGNEFHDNIVTNCASMVGATGWGCLGIGGQSGMCVYGNMIVQNVRADGANGYPIKYHNNGYNKALKIYNNTLTAAPWPTASFNFSIEFHHEQGGIEVYNNRISGPIDVSYVTKGAYSFGIDIHNNIIGWDSTPATQEMGIILEGDTDGIIIRNNLIKNVSDGIYISVTYMNIFNDVSIYYNVFQELYTTAATGSYKTWGIHFNGSPIAGSTGHSFYVYNNTFKAKVRTTGNYVMHGIMLPWVPTFSDCKIKNNIILNFYDAIAGTVNNTFDLLEIKNNIMYGNGGSNDPVWSNGFNPSNYTLAGTIKSDPLLTSTIDYHLKSTSPAKDAGLNVGLTKDYLGHSVPQNSLYDIGAYEYGSWILKSGGKIMMSGDKIVKIWR